MQYVVDHDYHIHSYISPCLSREARAEQTPEKILQCAREMGLSRIVITDHYWDEDVPTEGKWSKNMPKAYDLMSEVLPLPQAEGTRFYFGCEVEMDLNQVIGLAKGKYDRFDFIIVATTHMHTDGCALPEGELTFQERAELYVQRFQALLDADLPFEKVGLAHPTDPGIAPCEDLFAHLEVLDRIPDAVFENLFRQTAQKGMGVELNFWLNMYKAEDQVRVLRPYRIAKECGCKFYFGSDAHRPDNFNGTVENARDIIAALDLRESDKFHFPGE